MGCVCVRVIHGRRYPQWDVRERVINGRRYPQWDVRERVINGRRYPQWDVCVRVIHGRRYPQWDVSLVGVMSAGQCAQRAGLRDPDPNAGGDAGKGGMGALGRGTGTLGRGGESLHAAAMRALYTAVQSPCAPSQHRELLLGTNSTCVGDRSSLCWGLNSTHTGNPSQHRELHASALRPLNRGIVCLGSV